MTIKRIVVVILVAAAVLEGAALVWLTLRARWQREVEGTAVVRGRALAERMGCFGCHGPGGVLGIANPGSRHGGVPAWPGGTWMMWNESDEDVRAWIADGHPPGRQPDKGALIEMPAYGKRLTETELDDLTAYVLAVSQFGWLEDPAATEGYELAVEFSCFGCHGPEGRGLISNPGSFKGYVPPWDGDDFLELVRDEEEFRQWVRNGISDRFRANPAARRFLESQALPMPAYEDEINDEQVASLWAYVQWVRDNPRGGDAAR